MQVDVIGTYQRLRSTQYTLGYFCCPDVLTGMKYWSARCLLIQWRCKVYIKNGVIIVGKEVDDDRLADF